MGLLNLAATLGLNTSNFDSNLKGAEAKAKGFGSSVGGMFGRLKTALGATAVIGAVEELIRRSYDWAREIGRAAEQFDITSKEAINVEVAMIKVGKTVEDVGAALGRLGAFREKALEGDQKAAAVLKEFGISWADINDKSLRNYDLMLKISEAIQGVHLNPEQRQEFREMFGRSGDKFIKGLERLSKVKITLLDPEDEQAISRTHQRLAMVWLATKAMGARVIGSAVRFIERESGQNYGGESAAEIEKSLPSATSKSEIEKQGRITGLRSTLQTEQQRLAYEQLTAEQKINQLMRDRLTLQKLIKTEADPEKKLELELAMVKNKEMSSGLMNRREGRGRHDFQFDSAVRIGRFVGAASSGDRNAMVPIAAKQLKHLENIDKNTDPLSLNPGKAQF